MWNGFENYNSNYQRNDYNGYEDDRWSQLDSQYITTQNTPWNMIQEAPFNDEQLYAQRNSRNSNNNSMGAMPTSAPPSYTPTRNASTFRVDSGSIRHCIGRFTYIWQDNGMEYWMFPIHVSRTTVTGFRWSNRHGWSYTGVSLNRIDSFMCR